MARPDNARLIVSQPPLRPGWMAPWIALFLLLGCSRSPLQLGGLGGGGAAAQGGGGQGGHGGQGGAGGALVGGSGGFEESPCKLVSEDPLLALAGNNARQRQPRLSYSSNDREKVTVMVEWQVLGQPGAVPSELRHASLFAWSMWPQQGDLGPVYLANLDGGVSFDVAQAENNRMAVAFSDGGKPGPPTGIRFIHNLLPNDGNPAPDVGISNSGQRVLFTARSKADHLICFGRRGPQDERAGCAISRPFGQGTNIIARQRLVCGATPDSISAQGAAAADGWLLATSSASELKPSQCGQLGGTPDRILLVSVSGMGTMQTRLTLPQDAPVTAVRLAASDDGYWLAWALETASPSIRLVRLDASGQMAGPTATLNGTAGADPQTLQLAAMADGALVAWSSTNANTIAYQLINPANQVISAGGVAAEAPVLGDVLASPDGKALALAWHQSENNTERVYLSRLRCQSPAPSP